MKKEKKTLVVMAAGIGSRFGGGIKQLEPVGPNGEIIVDYSIYDALEAGFDKVVFVIRKDLEKDFEEAIGSRIKEKVEVAYAYQEVADIPPAYQEEFSDRKKPWGTGQAILACKDIVKEPFVVINADDYYGKDAYVKAYEYLTRCSGNCCGLCCGRDQGSKDILETAMVSFVLKNTLSDHGTVTRGVCKKNNEGYLESIVETSNIAKRGEKAVVLEEDKEVPISAEALVSMNMWCFFPELFPHLERGFECFLENLSQNERKKKNENERKNVKESENETENENVNENVNGKVREKENKNKEGKAYLKAEYLLPAVIDEGLKAGILTVKVLESKDSWFGVTYKEDKEKVVAEIGKLVEKGYYP